MVKRMCDDGIGFWHEPPYTEEEEDALYRGMAAGPAGITVVHGPRPSADQSPQRPKSPRQPQEE